MATICVLSISIFLVYIHVWKMRQINRDLKIIIMNNSIKQKISLLNLELIQDQEVTTELLHKLLAFQEDYQDFETWEAFNNNYFLCNNCNTYVDDQCICYTNK